jgi:hypothetical protein
MEKSFVAQLHKHAGVKSGIKTIDQMVAVFMVSPKFDGSTL